jgi:hypothetical protein
MLGYYARIETKGFWAGGGAGRHIFPIIPSSATKVSIKVAGQKALPFVLSGCILVIHAPLPTGAFF